VKHLLALAALAATTIAGCSKVDTTAPGTRVNPWTHRDVLTFTDASDIDSLNPMFTTELTVRISRR
jgi:hypothetical protein